MSRVLRLPVLALAAASLTGCDMYRSYGGYNSTALTVAAYETALQEASAASARTQADWKALEQTAQTNPALAPLLASYHSAMGEQDSLVKVHAAQLEAIKNPSLFRRIVGIGNYQYRKANEAYGALATEQNILKDRLARLGDALAGRPTTTTYLDGMVEDSRFYWTPPFYYRLAAATQSNDLLAAARTYRAPSSAPATMPRPAATDSAAAMGAAPMGAAPMGAAPMGAAPADTAHADGMAH